MDREALIVQLIADEGKKLQPYRDSRNNWTAGVGHLLRPQDHWNPKDAITETQCQAWLDQDIDTALATCHKVWSGYDQYPEDAQEVLAGMAFNLGETRLRGFELFIHAVEMRYWKRAAMQLRASLYYGQATQRVERYAKRLEALAHA